MASQASPPSEPHLPGAGVTHAAAWHRAGLLTGLGFWILAGLVAGTRGGHAAVSAVINVGFWFEVVAVAASVGVTFAAWVAARRWAGVRTVRERFGDRVGQLVSGEVAGLFVALVVLILFATAMP